MFYKPKIPKGKDLFLNLHLHNYYTSTTAPKTTLHGWLRYYLHLLADKISPMRHFIYKDPITLQNTPTYKRSDIGELPLISPMLMLMLEDNNININLPIYKTKSDRKRIFRAIEHGLHKLFKGKNIWLLPGRSGQSAYFYTKLGAKVGTSSDFRYIHNIINVFNTGKLGNSDNQKLHETNNLLFLIEGNLSNTIFLLANKINYIKQNYKKANINLKDSDAKLLFWTNKNFLPDFIISTNMINKKRFTDTNHSKINTTPLKILKQLILLGKPRHTKIYITPSTEHGSAISLKEINTLRAFADIKLFDQSYYAKDPSIIKTPSDFCFRAIVKENFKVHKPAL